MSSTNFICSTHMARRRKVQIVAAARAPGREAKAQKKNQLERSWDWHWQGDSVRHGIDRGKWYWMALIVVRNAFLNCSPIFRNRSHLYRRSNRLAICASFCQNSIANSISLTSSGVRLRDISVKIVITALRPCTRICQMHLHQFQLRLFGNGSIG